MQIANCFGKPPRWTARLPGGGAILAIDEIQKVKKWSSIVKLLWDEDDRLRMPLKVVLTGSSSLLLQKGLAESLMGRFEMLYSPHWNYAECK
ncbi:MAG: AAA family ATPase [Clostridiales bacterium]|nr:AAA family ATPase [Clostridiales bacterium]